MLLCFFLRTSAAVRVCSILFPVEDTSGWGRGLHYLPFGGKRCFVFLCGGAILFDEHEVKLASINS